MNTQNHIFAGAITKDGSLVNIFETTNTRKIKEMLEDDPRGFYKELKQHKLADENNKVFLWVSEE